MNGRQHLSKRPKLPNVSSDSLFPQPSVDPPVVLLAGVEEPFRDVEDVFAVEDDAFEGGWVSGINQRTIPTQEDLMFFHAR